MLGKLLEEHGWRQGSIVKDEDFDQLFPEFRDQDAIAVVASQSCDIANDILEDEPFVEFSIGRRIEKIDGNRTHGKNGRVINSVLLENSENEDVFNQINVEIRAFEKVFISKEEVVKCTPDASRLLVNDQLHSYIAWLASRYSRPALPTTFNDRIAAQDPKDKRKKKAKSVNPHLSGIYVELNPDAELGEDENYAVNLLGLVAPDFAGDLEKVGTDLEAYAEFLKKAGMDVKVAVVKEDNISLARFRRFKRFFYDDLSFRYGAPLPPKVEDGA